MTTITNARTTKTVLGLLAALGIALAGLAALPGGEAAARPCQLPKEPGEERPVCSIGAPLSGGMGGGVRDDLGRRIGEEIPTRRPVLTGGLAGGIEGTGAAPLFGGPAGGVGGDSHAIVIPQGN